MTEKHRLYLFDYDHTIIVSEEIAYKSLKYAIREMRPLGAIELDWDLVLSQAGGGTTEKKVARIIASDYGIPESQFDEFSQRFYDTRAKYLAEQSIVYGEIYDDALVTLRKIHEDPEALAMLVTGNPKTVMEQRINPRVRNFFQREGTTDLRGAFGDEGETRKDLILLAIQRAQKEGFTVTTDQHGIRRNVCYIGDTPNELISGIEARVMVVFVPNHGADNNSTRDLARDTITNSFVARDERLGGKDVDIFLAGDGAYEPTIFTTGLLSQPHCSTFLGIPTHPIRSPERESLLKIEGSRPRKELVSV